MGPIIFQKGDYVPAIDPFGKKCTQKIPSFLVNGNFILPKLFVRIKFDKFLEENIKRGKVYVKKGTDILTFMA